MLLPFVRLRLPSSLPPFLVLDDLLRPILPPLPAPRDLEIHASPLDFAAVEVGAGLAMVCFLLGHAIASISCRPINSVYAGGMAWESSSRFIQLIPIAFRPSDPLKLWPTQVMKS